MIKSKFNEKRTINFLNYYMFDALKEAAYKKTDSFNIAQNNNRNIYSKKRINAPSLETH
jgi:hypothetical protein